MNFPTDTLFQENPEAMQKQMRIYKVSYVTIIDEILEKPQLQYYYYLSYAYISPMKRTFLLRNELKGSAPPKRGKGFQELQQAYKQFNALIYFCIQYS